MELVDVNTTAAREHIGDIERGIRYVKERYRCSVGTFAIAGIEYLAKPIVICLVYNVAVLVNAVPASLGVSEQYSSREIVMQRKFDFKRVCRIQFGAYVQASDDVMITNTMKLRAQECVALGTAGNWQGSTKCFDLDTGEVEKRGISGDELPYPDRVIKRVKQWGKTLRDKKYTDSIEFRNHKRKLFDWENEELVETLPEPEEPVYPDVLAEVPGLVLKSE